MKYRVRNAANKELCGPYDAEQKHARFSDDAGKFITPDINIAFRHREYMDRDNRSKSYEVIEVDV